MTFSNINYNFNHIEEAKLLTDIVEQKLESLAKYIHDDETVKCDVEFRRIKSHQTGEVNKLEINLSVDGNFFRAEATEESFEKAIDKVKSELDQEMRTAKSKQETLDKQAGREVKEKLLDS